MENIEEIHFREGEFELSVRVEPQADTVWLNRLQMSQLFDRDIKTIGKHIQSALREGWKIQLSQNLRQLPDFFVESFFTCPYVKNLIE